MRLRLPTRDSATWKGFITACQVFVSGLVLVAADPAIQQFLTETYPQALPMLSAGAALAAILLGLARPSVKNY